jgi:hypothetical protein
LILAIEEQRFTLSVFGVNVPRAIVLAVGPAIFGGQPW